MAKQRAKRPCAMPQCPDFAVNAGYCDKHQDRIKKMDQARGNSHQRGYNHDWRKASKEYLAAHPLCVSCQKRNIIMPADVTDHITPHKGDKDKFWDQSNWQALCESCHNRKTASEDRGAWSPPSATAISTANKESKNDFKIGDLVVCTNPMMQSRLNCDDQKVWEVLDLINNTVEITDGDVIEQMHHSHFKCVNR